MIFIGIIDNILLFRWTATAYFSDRMLIHETIYIFRINSTSGMPETIPTPYSSTQAAKEGTDITKMTSFLSKTFFFDFPLLKLSEYIGKPKIQIP